MMPGYSDSNVTHSANTLLDACARLLPVGEITFSSLYCLKSEDTLTIIQEDVENQLSKILIRQFIQDRCHGRNEPVTILSLNENTHNSSHNFTCLEI